MGLERESDILIEKRQILTDKIKELNNLRTVQEREINHLEDSEKAIKQKCIDDDHKLTEQLSNKNNMTSVQETLRKQIDEQIKAKQTIQVNLSRSKADHSQLEDQFQAEKEAKKEVQRQYDISLNEVGTWKTKYETDAVTKAAELEDQKKKLTSKVGESEQAFTNATTKCENLEKLKSRLQGEIKDISAELDRALAKVSSVEKKQRGFSKALAEEDEKYARLALKLKEVLDERKAEVHQVFLAKQKLDELEEDQEAATKENKVLAEEVLDLKDQIQEGHKSMAEINKAKQYQ